MFSDEEGFKNALTGLYVLMYNQNVYGKELTFDFMEELAQRYDAGLRYSNVPDATRAQIYDYDEDYKSSQTFTPSKGRLSSIWNQMFKDIANINNLIKNLNERGQETITTPGLFELMKGEALGLRAYHYLDLMRMWGPADLISNGSRGVVPYRTEVSWRQTAPMSADSMTIMIEKDLLEAETLLKDDACEYGNLSDAPFFAYRQHRMNKWALKALMARFYLYTNQYDKAAVKAKAVIDSCGLRLVGDMSEDHALFDETLFALDYGKMHDNVEVYFDKTIEAASQTQKLISKTTVDRVYETATVGINDIRARNNQGFLSDGTNMVSRKFLHDDDATNYNNKVPLIRLAEMYLILAETLSGTDGVAYYNSLRNLRGISATYNVSSFTSRDELVAALQKEYAKEFLGEGQYFYFLKRVRATTFDRCPVTMQDRHYEFIIPDDEKQYGYVPEENEQ